MVKNAFLRVKSFGRKNSKSPKTKSTGAEGCGGNSNNVTEKNCVKDLHNLLKT